MQLVSHPGHKQNYSDRRLAYSSTVALAVTLATLTPLASAETNADAAAPSAATVSESTLSEVVVTAERRTVSLQKVDIAASALGASELQKKSVNDIADLENATPSLSVIDQGFSQSLNIRGIGLAVVSPQVSPGIATYRDGVFLPTQTSLFQPFYDLQDVQVLRGPQGTFAGQTATGGAIYINSASPKLDAGTTGDLTVGYGNFSDVQLSGGINLPINDQLAARIAFNDQDRDSFYKSLNGTSEHPGNLHEKDVRVGLLWQPDDALTVLWKNEYDRYSNDSFAAQPIAGTAFYGVAPTQPFVIDYGATGLHFENDYFLSSLQVNYKFDNGITLKTNTGYQNDLFIATADQAAAPVTGYLETDKSPEEIWTEDISLVSPDSGKLKWVLGSTFFDYRVNPVHAVETTPQSVVDIAVSTPKRSYGFFGSTTYNFTPTFDVQAGLRYSHDQVGQSGTVTITSPAFTVALPQGVPNYTDNEVTGKVALDWNPDPNDMVYAFVAKGYKPGGANNGASSFDPEVVWDYEGGWKSTEFGGHLRTQLGAFFMNYQHFQVSEYSPIAQGSAVTNADSDSKIKGLEAQGQLQFGAFGADASVAYIKSNIGHLPAQIDSRQLPNTGTGLGPPCAAGQPAAGCFDYTPYVQAIPNGPNIYSPDVTANVGVQYALDAGHGFTVTPRADLAYVGSQWATFFEAPEDFLKARTLVDAQINVQHDQWKVQAYGTNLFNKVYVSGFSLNFGNNYFLLPPRQFGVRVTREF
jgi:iron complex outermembrane receptor protein